MVISGVCDIAFASDILSFAESQHDTTYIFSVWTDMDARSQ